MLTSNLNADQSINRNVSFEEDMRPVVTISYDNQTGQCDNVTHKEARTHETTKHSSLKENQKAGSFPHRYAFQIFLLYLRWLFLDSNNPFSCCRRTIVFFCLVLFRRYGYLKR